MSTINHSVTAVHYFSDREARDHYLQDSAYFNAQREKAIRDWVEKVSGWGMVAIEDPRVSWEIRVDGKAIYG